MNIDIAVLREALNRLDSWCEEWDRREPGGVVFIPEGFGSFVEDILGETKED